MESEIKEALSRFCVYRLIVCAANMNEILQKTLVDILIFDLKFVASDSGLPIY